MYCVNFGWIFGAWNSSEKIGVFWTAYSRKFPKIGISFGGWWPEVAFWWDSPSHDKKNPSPKNPFPKNPFPKNLRNKNPHSPGYKSSDFKKFRIPGKRYPDFHNPKSSSLEIGIFYWGFLGIPIPQSPSNSKCPGIFSNAKRKIPSQSHLWLATGHSYLHWMLQRNISTKKILRTKIFKFAFNSHAGGVRYCVRWRYGCCVAI